MAENSLHLVICTNLNTNSYPNCSATHCPAKLLSSQIFEQLTKLFIVFCFSRGVFQGLIDKHFPAPDWKKDFDLDNDCDTLKPPAVNQKKRKGSRSNPIKTKITEV